MSCSLAEIADTFRHGSGQKEADAAETEAILRCLGLSVRGEDSDG